jgi:hypothetical protein
MRWIAACLVLLACTTPAHAQQAPVYMQPGHWSYDALKRLSTAGLTPPAADPVWAQVTLRHALAVFDSAAALASAEGRTHLAAQAAAYAATLRSEADTAGLLAAAVVRAGWAEARGEALGGDGFYTHEDWEGAQPIPDVRSPAAAVAAHGHLLPWVAWSVDVGWLGEELRVPSALLTARAGPIDVFAGRHRLHYGIGHGGGTVIGGGRLDVPDLIDRTQYAFEGVGLVLREPFRYPGFLRFLGPSRIEVAGGRLDRNGLVERPWIVFGRLMSSPFSDRFTIGLNRGAIFGGEGNPVTLVRMLGLLAGVHGGEGGEFENQVISVLMRYRPPLGALPLAAYVEWGMDDTSGAVRDTPGTVFGVDIGPLPGLPALSLGVERTGFPGSWRGKPPWYRNVFFRGSWADEGRLFAHPLGGHGREFLAHARLDLPEPGLFAGAELFSRERRFENLFAPEREGSSWGGSLTLQQTLHGRTALRLDATIERGDGWDTGRFAATIRHGLVGGAR